MKNKEVFLVDPLSRTIPNDGVTTVFQPKSEREWEVLRYELSNFVCEGEYAKGMHRILDTYLKNLTKPKQPAVWVSGFYGSGKSHFLRVLEFLWRDVTLPDGSSSRGLVSLPTEINDALKELTTAGKREGGLWSAAGTLGAGAGSSVRLAFLAIVLSSAGLPTQYAPARFVLWLRKEGYLDAVTKSLQSQDRQLSDEVNNLYVSPKIAQALLQADPNLADNEKGVRSLLMEQFPNKEDITDDELETILRDLLDGQSSDGRTPCTLIVLDELQQFINEDADLALHVQNVVELVQSRFESKIVIVGSGQNALNATPALSKLMGRFTVNVALSDADVETVIRKVVLEKAPAKVPEINKVLDKVSGEINRHLAGSRIGAHPSDEKDLVPDYPLLPVRRRFWEVTLRAIDRAGTGGQLRTQLRMVHEGTQRVANDPIGTVVPGDFIYEQQASGMLQSGVLPREIEETVKTLNDDTEDGKLRARLCSLIFLVSKLPDEGESEGIRATKETLADLLVTELPVGSAGLRQRIPELLDELVEIGKLMKVEDHYLIQTQEWADWDAAYKAKRQEISGDEPRIVDQRSNEIRGAVGRALGKLSLQHGVSKTPRNVELHFSTDPPSNQTEIPVWIRDEWSVTSRAVRDDAAAGGVESPIVFVFIPRIDAEAIRQGIINLTAARATLETRPASTTQESIEARAAMESRLNAERAKLDALLEEMVTSAKVYQGGGNEIAEGDLRTNLEAAAKGSLVRLYSKFSMADHASWGTALKRAADGDPSPFSIVGHIGDAKDHPVCKELIAFIGANWKKGSEIRKRFDEPAYGWPKDAIDAGLLALVASGWLDARQSGQPVAANQITQAKIGVTEFKGQEVPPPSAPQRIEMRKLMTDAGMSVTPNQEVPNVPALLQRLIDLAGDAGGEAPLPERPSILQIQDLLNSGSGNELFASVFDKREELKASLVSWKQAKERAAARLPAWERLNRLATHAVSLEGNEEIQTQIEAIMTQRSLLGDQDQMPTLTQQVADKLRDAIHGSVKELAQAFKESLTLLESTPEWQALGGSKQKAILMQVGLSEPEPPSLGTPDELLAALDRSPLSSWQDKVAALPGRMGKARTLAAKELEPKAMKIEPPKATLKTESDVDEYIAQLRSLLIEKLKDGPIII